MSILNNGNNGQNGGPTPSSPSDPGGGWNEVPQNPSNFTQGNKSKGYNVNVTPENPFERAAPITTPPRIAKRKNGSKFNLKYLLLVLIVVFIVVVALISVHKPAPTVTTTASTVSPNVYTMSACGTITKPGSYYINGDIKTNITSGSCININSSDVALTCNGKSITGSGPYSNKIPYTYAVYSEGKSNVSIKGCTISEFSYGIEFANSTKIGVSGNKLYNNTMSGVYLSNTSDSFISNNKVSGSDSPQGGIFIGPLSFNNSILNNSLKSEGSTGISISSPGQRIIQNNINSTPNSFMCYGSSGLINASTAASNKCSTNYGCDFLSCNVSNYPVNISEINISYVFNGCGVINSPGDYHLSQNINAGLYLKAKGALNLTTEVPCITISAPDVHIDCESDNISNVSFGYAIYAKSVSGLTISYCGINSSKGGILLDNVAGANISNITTYSTNIGIKLTNSSKNTFSGIKAIKGSIGMYVNSSTLDSFR